MAGAEAKGPKDWGHRIAEEQVEEFNRRMAERAAKKTRQRVGFDFDGTIATILNRQVAKFNEQMRRVFGEAAEGKVMNPGDLKMEGVWYVNYGLTAGMLETLYKKAFRELFESEGNKTDIALVKKPELFIKVLTEWFPESGIISAAPHWFEDLVKAYIRKTIGETYVRTNEETGEEENAKIPIDVETVQSSQDKFNADQTRYNILIDDNRTMTKKFILSWYGRPDEDYKQAEKWVLLIDQPYNQTLQIPKELQEAGLVRRVKDINEALETMHILHELRSAEVQSELDRLIHEELERLNSAQSSGARRITEQDLETGTIGVLIQEAYKNAKHGENGTVKELGEHKAVGFADGITVGTLIAAAHKEAESLRKAEEKLEKESNRKPLARQAIPDKSTVPAPQQPQPKKINKQAI
ncbi:MAG: hypothetical protein KGH66_02545 [Candidatus Micrarchaeota archaeon]|nr:hypothetical protein [Candidatus Micrarchaeota archaeon]